MTFYILLAFVTVLYFVYSYTYLPVFRRTAGIFLTKRQQRLHLVLIWMIPFVWVLLLKNTLRPTRRYRKHPRVETDPAPVHPWMLGAQTFLHGNAYTNNSSSVDDTYTGNYSDEFSADSLPHDINYSGGDSVNTDFGGE